MDQRFLSGLCRIVVPIALGFLWSCGGAGAPEESGGVSGEPEASAPAADLCGFLTAADIEEVVGAAPGEPEPGDEGLGQCSWPAADGSGTLARLTLDEAILDSFDDFVMEFGRDFGGENPPRDRFHPVESLGDWAMYVADDSEIRVFRGEEVLEVRSEAAEGDEETLKALAGRAVDRWQ